MAEWEWHEGDVIRKCRSIMGWTLLALADVAEVNVAVIHRLEFGLTKDPRKATLERIADAFGLTLRQLREMVPPKPTGIELKAKRQPSRSATAVAKRTKGAKARRAVKRSA